MKTEHKTFRDKLLYQIWEENKNEVSMDFIAEVFKVSLMQAYRIIREQDKVAKGH